MIGFRESNGKQAGPIWQLRWIDRNKGTGEDKGGEVLVSGSADGRITQWSIRKGFEFQGKHSIFTVSFCLALDEVECRCK